jgi:hypothetical protein
MNIPIPVDKPKSGSGVRNLERLSVERYCSRIVVFHPSRQQVEALVAQARRDLPQITDLSVVRRVIAHNPDNFWIRHGFRPLENAAEFVFSDFEYVEMVADLEPLPQAIHIGTDPYVVIRPEGCWDRPGVLEYSIVRAASSPSVAS